MLQPLTQPFPVKLQLCHHPLSETSVSAHVSPGASSLDLEVALCQLLSCSVPNATHMQGEIDSTVLSGEFQQVSVTQYKTI